MLDPADPYSIGAMVGPEAFEEVRYLAHARQLTALGRIGELGAEFAEAFGRDSGGLVHPYRSADADVVVVAMGSVLGTIKDVVDAQRAAGHRIGAVGITSFRPFPIDAVRNALKGARQVVVVEKAISVGFGGVLSTDVAMTLTGLPVPVATVVAGLGGRAITKASLGGVFEAALPGRAGAPDLPRPQYGPGRTRARAHGLASPLRAHGQKHAARPRRHRLGDRLSQAVRFYQVGSFAVGNRLVSRADRTVQSGTERPIR